MRGQPLTPNSNLFLCEIPQRMGNAYLKYKIANVNDFLHFKASMDSRVTFVHAPPHEKNFFKKDMVHFNHEGINLLTYNIMKAMYGDNQTL